MKKSYFDGDKATGFRTYHKWPVYMMTAHEITQQENTTEQLIEELYEPAFYRVAKLVSRAGGSYEEARDVFHDSLEIYYTQKRYKKSIASDINYIAGIARHLWLNRVRGFSRLQGIDDLNTSAEGQAHPNEQKLLQVMESTGRRCLDLLVSFYYERMSISSLKRKFGFTSEHSASVQKYKCIEKLREVVKSNSLDYADFFE